MRETSGVTARIAAAMTRAQSGHPAEAAADVRRLLAELGPDPSSERAAAEYVRAVAAHHGMDAEEALDAVDDCVRVARAIEEPGWEANALAVRIVTLIRTGEGGDSVADLVAAENALARTRDPGLLSWGNTGLGYAYDLLRLFELCIPHFELAAEADADPLGVPESPAINRLNLAESNLRWTHEMERLGDSSYDEEIRRRRLEAKRWAAEANEVIVRARLIGYWRMTGRMWLAASEYDVNPGGAAVILKDCRDQLAKLGALEVAAIAGAYLAKAYAAMGQLDDAMEAAERANTDLPPTSDPPVEALVRHTAVQIVADSGDTGAASGLQYARAITRGWWAERLRGLYAVRSALATHDLSIRHDAEWRAAREDPLTGVGNRRALDERMTAALDSGRSVAVLAIDVDNLKVVNDSHGHACGDEVLRRVAHLLTEQCRAEDVVARAGGDEFVVVLDNPDERGARELVERIRAAAERVATDAEEPWFAMLRLSIGHAATTDGTAVGDLLTEADRLMYAEKRHRRAGGLPRQ
ncbi:diguanylate cyclase (GGDEF)-like protein [Kribbella orskensis]|uniref:Diguanylate cyclase (GGDEF)-like protein n=1 Tax=Kribbella orskensis TaxID=2512216 RepID=A0ABY2BIX0_9ACTN|nr:MULTISPECIES: GGDEF domain-containing protein [Kribbella]TCN39127.1 diguanylate cyclase (GGDEF)-like protein [Kribbella sp. VKM Ac-2500]TCO21774.1 diguanylate cyclase (GGDEF)-like protein [Kribbella orskensis]